MMVRRILAAVLLVVLLLGGSVLPISAVESDNDTETGLRMRPLQDKLAVMTTEDVEGYLLKFKDMQKHWGCTVVGKLTGLEIIAGNGDGTFKPDNPVQVDQFIKMVVSSLGFKPGSDLKYWAQPYIDTALKYKIITAAEFKDYKRNMTREEAARIIVKAALMRDAAPNSDMDNLVRSKIADYSKIKDGNKQFVLQAYELGLMAGANGRFLPGNTLTRAEASAVIIRNLDTASRVPFKPAEGDVFVITNPDGTVHTVYPPPKAEVLKAANAFKTAYTKSKGWVWHGYSEEGHRIGYLFYEKEENQDLEGNRMQMAVDLDTVNNDYLMEHPYYIIVYNAAAVKRLHRDTIYEMFKFWFAKDVDKAMVAFDRYLECATNNDQKNRVEEITYNGRLMFFYKVGGDDRFKLTINSLPK